MRTSDVETFLLENGRNVSAQRKNVSTIASNTAVEIARGHASALTRNPYQQGASCCYQFSALLSFPHLNPSRSISVFA